MTAEFLAQTTGLLLFPGLISILVFGVVVEAGARALFGIPDGRLLLPQRQRGRRRLAPAAAAAAGLLALGATQVAIPLNPVPDAERTLLLAIGALAAAGWLLWLFAGAGTVAGRALLVAQVTWTLALLSTALASGTLLPGELSISTLPLQVAARAAAATAYLLALPGLLLLFEPELRLAPAGQMVRLLSWGPQTALFASLVLPGLRANAAGVLLFALICVAASAGAVLLGLVLRRRPQLVEGAYPRLLGVVAGVALILGILATYLP